MTKLEKIKIIKSYKEPPFNKEDIYNLRYPWPLLGGVSSGICMKWCWFRNEICMAVLEEDIDIALEEITNGSKEHNSEV